MQLIQTSAENSLAFANTLNLPLKPLSASPLQDPQRTRFFHQPTLLLFRIIERTANLIDLQGMRFPIGMFILIAILIAKKAARMYDATRERIGKTPDQQVGSFDLFETRASGKYIFTQLFDGIGQTGELDCNASAKCLPANQAHRVRQHRLQEPAAPGKCLGTHDLPAGKSRQNAQAGATAKRAISHPIHVPTSAHLLQGGAKGERVSRHLQQSLGQLHRMQRAASRKRLFADFEHSFGDDYLAQRRTAAKRPCPDGLQALRQM